ncbi:helix-turn-helix transcriptional regulator [Chachezhania sediminis]|uniref:helix-turn-helix transcriptional regulator n=1 Tax=Chachezhania sediminis TaxID=2599291 RepID=UPI00131C1921|nr:hypothetical protein [Chachezhania sediminis]
MAELSPIAVREKHAAAMLDMPVTDFRRLVSQGALPRPVRIGSFDRWRVDQLRATLDGTAALPDEGFEL